MSSVPTSSGASSPIPSHGKAIINWPDVAWAGLDRLRRQADLAPLDEIVAELVRLAQAAVEGTVRPDAPAAHPVVCPWYRVGEQVVKTIGVAARFDATAEITLDELRIELTYPLYEPERKVLPRPWLVHPPAEGRFVGWHG